MRVSARLALALVFTACMTVIAGCDSGPPRFVVKGKISNKGQVIPVKVTESQAGGRLRVYLKSAEDAANTEVWEARVNYADGSFVIAGSDGRGVPKGKYKVCVEWKDKFPLGKDLLNKKFSEENTKIIRDVPLPEGTELIIDVSKAQG